MAEDGVTFYPAGALISGSCSSRVPDEQAASTTDGKLFPIGQIEGAADAFGVAADYTLYSVDLKQTPPALILKG